MQISELLWTTLKLPQQLQPYVKDVNPASKFLVGYRNIIVRQGNALKWKLIKDSKCCGKVYSFEVKEESDKANLQLFKSGYERIQKIGERYIALFDVKLEGAKTILELNKLDNSEIQCLLQEIGGANIINVNILKNVFTNYEDYVHCVGKELNFTTQQPKNIKIDQRFVKEKLFQLPKCNLKTGNWDSPFMINLEIKQ